MSSSKKYDFTGKVALVTGSSTGIGAAIALQLAQYGAKLTITGRKSAALASVAQKIKSLSGVEAHQILGDLQDESFVVKLIEETIAKFGRLDVLVNNAGGASESGRLSSPKLLAEFDSVFKLNVRSVVQLTQLAVPHLEKVKGNIINISSIAGLRPGMLVYSASKAALDMITKTSALELGPKGIRVNSVNPGPVVTEFLRSMGLNSKEVQDKFYQDFTAGSLMGRVGVVEDIANLVSFLASEDAKNITGSIMVSDSGFLLSGTRPAILSQDRDKKE